MCSLRPVGGEEEGGRGGKGCWGWADGCMQPWMGCRGFNLRQKGGAGKRRHPHPPGQL